MKKLITCLALAVATAFGGAAFAGTPKDTLVMAKNIDDIITLDPAQVFEFSGGEISANIYDRITMYEPEDLTKLVGGVAKSWSFSDDGKTITLTVRPGLKFHSGNPVTAEDVAWSLQRVVKLDQAPSFILTQFGWTKDNVDGLVKALDPETVQVTIKADFSPGLVLNAFSAGVGSVVDMKTAMAHEKDGDLGHDWLNTHSAGSGAYMLKTWNANEAVILDANNDYRHGAPSMKRVIIRHVPEPAPQRLLLEKGDVDMARDLTADQIAGLEGAKGIAIDEFPAALLQYVATNYKNPILSNPKVNEALRWLIDYQGMANTFLKGTWKVHQAFWPEGMWAALNTTPYHLDVAKGKALLAEAGYPDGFEVTLDAFNTSPYQEMAQSIQQTFGQAGIKVDILPAEKKAVYTKHRARKHELILSGWSPDYADPHSNADAFASNPDNSDEAKLTGVLAWRNAWDMPDITKMTAAARTELDLDKRKQMYLDIQREVQQRGPFNIMFQKVNQIARRDNVHGFVAGPLFDQTYYRNVTK